MAQDTEVRAFVVYYGDGQKKVGTLMTNNYDIDFGRTALHTVDGVVYSKGQIVTRLAFDKVEAIGGDGIGMLKDALAQKSITIGVVQVDGSVLLSRMAPIKASFKGEVEKGTASGNWEFGGGKPVVQSI